MPLFQTCWLDIGNKLHKMAGEAPSKPWPVTAPGAEVDHRDGQTVRGQLFICGPRYTGLQWLGLAVKWEVN